MSTLRVRIAYTKMEEAKYIAHLDLTKVFERALRRAGVRLAYSEGFNPHPKLAFGSALAVGVEGAQEYLDIELEQEIELDELLGRLQEQLPAGIRIIEGRQITSAAKALMAVLNSASYQVRANLSLPLKDEKLQESIAAWLAREHVPYLRYSKKGKVEKDIRPWVKELSGKIQGEEAVFEIEVEMGNQGSVRPEEIVASLCDMGNLPLDLEHLRIKRTGIYVSYNGQKLSPLDEASGK